MVVEKKDADVAVKTAVAAEITLETISSAETPAAVFSGSSF